MVKIKLTSIENSSVIRKFTILYLLMSILPVTVLYYFYLQLSQDGKIEITPANFNLTLTFIVLGALVGFGAMRAVLKNIVDLTRTSKETLEEILGPQKLKELTENNNEVAILARSFSEITGRLEENIRNLELAKKTLHSVLSRVGQGISSMQNIDSFLELIVETVTQALTGKTGVLMLFNESENVLYAKSVYGMPFDKKSLSRMKIADGPFGSIVKSGKPLMIPKMNEGETASKEHGLLFETPVLCAPLLLHAKVLGVIAVSGRRIGANFNEEEMNLLYNLASQTAVAIENAKLNSDAEKIYLETISALALAVEAKDPYSRGHLDRVSAYCEKVGRKLNLNEEDVKLLKDGARLHDLGKIGVVDEILRKQGSLSPEEWKIMRKHTEIGEGIIKPIHSLSKLCDIIRHHHEKLDGSGYPDGLKGEEISLLVRILSVADIYDALTTDRPYRKAYPREQAKEELIKMKGKIDPKVVDTFLETL